MKKISFCLLACILIYAWCEYHIHFAKVRQYPADVAVASLNSKGVSLLCL
jgi:hypothetical protein